MFGGLPSWELTYLLPVEDYFLFPQVGYVSFLEDYEVVFILS